MLVLKFQEMIANGGQEVPRGLKIKMTSCLFCFEGLGNMANRCDGDQLVVGACGGGFNSDCPGAISFSLVIVT